MWVESRTPANGEGEDGGCRLDKVATPQDGCYTKLSHTYCWHTHRPTGEATWATWEWPPQVWRGRRQRAVSAPCMATRPGFSVFTRHTTVLASALQVRIVLGRHTIYARGVAVRPPGPGRHAHPPSRPPAALSFVNPYRYPTTPPLSFSHSHTRVVGRVHVVSPDLLLW